MKKISMRAALNQLQEFVDAKKTTPFPRQDVMSIIEAHLLAQFINELTIATIPLEIADGWRFFEENLNYIKLIPKQILTIITNPVHVKVGFAERILTSKDMTEVLSNLPEELAEDIREIFKDIMRAKIMVSCQSFAYSTNYRLFIDWFPKLKDEYPEVLAMIREELFEQRRLGMISLICREEKELFEMYCLPGSPHYVR